MLSITLQAPCSLSPEYRFFLKVVTDLICFCTYFFNLNVVLTGSLVIYRLCQELVTLPDLSCNLVSIRKLR